MVKYRVEESVRWLFCPHCTKRFKKPLDMVRHLRIHNSVKPYKCQVCHRPFRLKSTLMSHINSHSGAKNFACQLCGKKLASRTSLVLHQRLHNGQRPYSCGVCDKKFRHRSYFKVHVQSHERMQKLSSTVGNSKTNSLPTKSSSNNTRGGGALAEPLQVTQSGQYITIDYLFNVSYVKKKKLGKFRCFATAADAFAIV